MKAALHGRRVITPLYNGVADEVAAADALLNRTLVDLAIYDSRAAAAYGMADRRLRTATSSPSPWITSFVVLDRCSREPSISRP